MRIPALLFASLLLASPAAADGVDRTVKTNDICEGAKAEIADFGIYEANLGERVAADGLPGGYNTIVWGKELRESTDHIPATEGLHFGFRYKLTCERGASDEVPVTITVRHPEIKNPETHRSQTESSWTDNAWTSMLNMHTGWGFDEPWEAVPGKWRIELRHRGKLLAEKEFTIVPE